MTFGSRIRIYLVAVAVVPSLVLLGLVYYFIQRDHTLADQRKAHHDLGKFHTYQRRLRSDVRTRLAQLVVDPGIVRTAQAVAQHQPPRLQGDPRVYRLDFVEVVDSVGIVRSSFDRPGLTNQVLTPFRRLQQNTPGEVVTSIEYDADGAHIAFSGLTAMTSGTFVYAGKYMDSLDLEYLSDLLDADLKLYADTDAPPAYASMALGEIYRQDDMLQGMLIANEDPPVYLVASFRGAAGSFEMDRMLTVALLVAMLSGLVAIALGLLITGRAQREITNLVQASTRVAGGDLSTPVMAYEEGEFSLLADSLSDMMVRLRRSRQRLAAAEKIAAWQQVGRKVAHEIKNPLTPISIGIDDLRLSFKEGQPDLANILEKTTSTIKEEIGRITDLLDQFVGFARMKSPEPRKSSLDEWMQSLSALFASEIRNGRLQIKKTTNLGSFHFDPDALKQVAINLIKNSLEAGPDTSATMTVTCDPQAGLLLRVEDDGPGFDNERLADPFRPYTSTKKTGTGLGLVVVLRLVQDHGGHIELYNRPNGGAGILIEIPRI
ncbi:MAG: ATP-binding protein [bacterium]